MLSQDLLGLAASFQALAVDEDHTFVVGQKEAENFAAALFDYSQQAAALEGPPIPTAIILQFPQGVSRSDDSPTPGDAA